MFDKEHGHRYLRNIKSKFEIVEIHLYGVSGKCFLLDVPDWQAEIMKEAIVQYIQPGSHIVSDSWAASARTE